MATRLEAIRRRIERWQDSEHSCEYGHFDCSDVKGGPCIDELLGRLHELEEE